MTVLVHLLKKEILLELRRKSVIAGIGLYLFSLVFICYITFSLRQQSINAATWSALFWLCILFAMINSLAKSFIGERKGLALYYYTLASPQAIILSKIIYNTILALVLAFTGLLFFTLFIGNPIQDPWVFTGALMLSSLGFASSLSLISGLAAKANNSAVLMAVLSFPVLISILLMAVRITKNAVDGIAPSASVDELLNLLAINCIATTLAYLLFPYIWRS